MAFTVFWGILSLCFQRVHMVAPDYVPKPIFDFSVVNVSVKEGGTAILPCAVDFKGYHLVGWTDRWSTLLTLDDRRMMDDLRISIEQPSMRDWNLQICDTTRSDHGQYNCQINTRPVESKVVNLIVQVPSRIVDKLSSRDKTVRQSDTVTLVCNVTGVPKPQVTWYKRPLDDLKNESKERLKLDSGVYTFLDTCAYTLNDTGVGSSGEVLIIRNLSQNCNGTYECVAYNGVWPAVTRRIKVFVASAEYWLHLPQTSTTTKPTLQPAPINGNRFTPSPRDPISSGGSKTNAADHSLHRSQTSTSTKPMTQAAPIDVKHFTSSLRDPLGNGKKYSKANQPITAVTIRNDGFKATGVLYTPPDNNKNKPVQKTSPDMVGSSMRPLPSVHFLMVVIVTYYVTLTYIVMVVLTWEDDARDEGDRDRRDRRNSRFPDH